MQGTLHNYHPTRSLLLFSHHHPSPTPPPNTLLFIGGMFDNFLSPSYTISLSRLLSHSPHWRLCHVQLSSAGRAFGTSSLIKDVQEIETAVRFVRETLHGGGRVDGGGREGTGKDSGKIVLMGHSTGCQDALSYLYLPTSSSSSPSISLSSRPKVDGIILQAPVSDREGADPTLDPNNGNKDSATEHNDDDTTNGNKVTAWRNLIDLARSTPEKEHRTTILPLHKTTPFFGPAPLSVERFLSLASPESPDRPGMDDLLSSDATEEWLGRTWGVSLGRIEGEGDGEGRGAGVLNSLPERGIAEGQGKREVLVLMSGEDEHCPAWVDKEELLGKWRAAVEKAGGGVHEASAVLDEAVHDLSGEGWEQRWGREVEMRERVVRYLEDVIGEQRGNGKEMEGVWEVLRREREVLLAEREGGGGGEAERRPGGAPKI